MRLARNFSLAELLHSDRFPQLVPQPDDLPWQHIAMLSRLTHEVLQPLRDQAAVPVWILSGYRDPVLNRAVGAGQWSRHQIDVRGHLFAAADLQVRDLPAEEVFRMLAIEPGRCQFDRVCLYPGRNFLHIDIKDWTFGPPSMRYYVNAGGWREVGRTDAARSSW